LSCYYCGGITEEPVVVVVVVVVIPGLAVVLAKSMRAAVAVAR
jgi:hypothetical protein